MITFDFVKYNGCFIRLGFDKTGWASNGAELVTNRKGQRMSENEMDEYYDQCQMCERYENDDFNKAEIEEINDLLKDLD